MRFHTVNIGNLKIGYNHPVRVMGAINLSPESFYQESIVSGPENLIEVVRRMEKEGVDIFDIGARSTAPKAIYGTSTISVDEELSRIKDSMGIIRDTTTLPISIDTTSAKVAETALDLGADLVNDVSGLSSDPMMAQLVAENEVPVILMSVCESPCPSLQASIDSLTQSLERANSFDISDNLIIIDPGIGFGKPVSVDLALLKNLRRFVYFGYPVLVGVSRKAFIGTLLNLQDPAGRLTGTIAATSIAIANGANVIRAHDVKEAKMAAKIGESLRKISPHSIDTIELLGICDEKEAEIVIERIGTGPSITKSLARKAVVLNILISGLKTSAALIIKQEMLALGGDAAYHHDVIDSQIKVTDVLIMGTPLQLQRLATKMAGMKYFGLNRISDTIAQLLSEREERRG
jgi:dihydropteroate synthase